MLLHEQRGWRPLNDRPGLPVAVWPQGQSPVCAVLRRHARSVSDASIFVTVFNLLVLFQLHSLHFTTHLVFSVDHSQLNYGLSYAAIIVNG